MSEKQEIGTKDIGKAKEILGDPSGETPIEAEPVFTLKPVKEKPRRAYRKGSKYDPVLEKFLESPDKLMTLTVEGKDANYMRTQLNKRVEAKNLEKKLKVSVINNVLYLEKI